MARWAGSRDGRKKGGKTTESLRSPFETPSRLLRSPFVTSRVQHARSTLAAGWALAECSGGGNKIHPELPDYNYGV
jgi:hypothetical protein